MNTSHHTPLPRRRSTARALSARRSATAALLAALALATLAAPPLHAGIATAELPQVGYHPGSVHYYNAIRFGNLLSIEDRGWVPIKSDGSADTLASDQVDSLGNPQYLAAGQSYLRAWPGQNNPDKAMLTGRVVVAWEGEADIRLGSGTFLANGDSSIPAGQPQSNGSSTGLINNGQRVYHVTGSPNGLQVRVHAITGDSAKKPKNIKVWLADPATGNSLKNQLWHPKFIERLNENSWGHIRFMDLTQTNGNPQQDWSDRRRPNHTFQNGVINARNPAPGVVWYTEDDGTKVYFTASRPTGVAWEHLVALCNETEKDLWINIPHLATSDYITQLARLIRYGAAADGTPYTSSQTNPAYAPLASGLKVFIEFSNEIWSGGNDFPQGAWAGSQASAAGISKAKFNARKFCDAWKIFRDVFGSDDRLVKVAAVWNAQEDYTTEFLGEIKTYGAGLSPAQEPDLIAGTTYFGNGMQDWVHQKAKDQAGTSDPWFYTTATFDHDGETSTAERPVSLAITDAYWTSSAFDRHLDAAFDEWTGRLLSGSAAATASVDTTNVGGGFRPWLRTLAQTTFSTAKPVVAYEGGHVATTTHLDGGDSRDDGVTDFMSELVRHLRMAEVYRIHLNMAKAKGLWSHMMFLDVSSYGKYDVTGHLENSLLASNADSPKYQFLLDWTQEANALRHIDNASGSVPSFVESPKLESAFRGMPYKQTVTTTGGNGTRTLELVGKTLSPGLSASIASGVLTVSGTPTTTDSSYVHARVKDGDGDPAWRIFTITGLDPAINRFVQDSGTNGLLSMEVENATLLVARSSGGTERSWSLLSSQSDASGSAARKVTPDTGASTSAVDTESPLAQFDVKIVKSGTHTLYLRAKASPDTGTTANADSVHVGLDGLRLTTDSGLGNYGSSYSWKSISLGDLAPGYYTIQLWMREDGLVADKIVVSTNSSASSLGLTGSSTGPAESTRQTYDIRDGFKGRWNFEGNTNDVSGVSGITGSLGGGAALSTTVAKQGSGGLNLTASGSLMSISGLVRPTAAFTYAVWVRPGANITTSSARQDVLYGISGAGPHLTFNRDANGAGRAGLFYNIGGSSGQIYSAQRTWNANQWYHLAFTYDGSKVRVYVDGVEDNTPVNRTGGAAASTGMYVGARSSTGTDRFNGHVDDVRVYDRALTADEVKTIKAITY